MFVLFFVLLKFQSDAYFWTLDKLSCYRHMHGKTGFDTAMEEEEEEADEEDSWKHYQNVCAAQRRHCLL